MSSRLVFGVRGGRQVAESGNRGGEKRERSSLRRGSGVAYRVRPLLMEKGKQAVGSGKGTERETTKYIVLKGGRGSMSRSTGAHGEGQEGNSTGDWEGAGEMGGGSISCWLQSAGLAGTALSAWLAGDPLASSSLLTRSSRFWGRRCLYLRQGKEG